MRRTMTLSEVDKLITDIKWGSVDRDGVINALSEYKDTLYKREKRQQKYVIYHLTLSGPGSSRNGYLTCTYNREEFKPELTGYFEYLWDDGWRADIYAYEATRKECRNIDRIKTSFYGYEWMVDSIEKYGRIVTEKDLQKEAEAKAKEGIAQ
jgi:hypothetical protein